MVTLQIFLKNVTVARYSRVKTESVSQANTIVAISMEVRTPALRHARKRKIEIRWRSSQIINLSQYGEHDTMLTQLMIEQATLNLQIRQSEKDTPNFLRSRTVRPKANLELH
jgi:hypothetical protein